MATASVTQARGSAQSQFKTFYENSDAAYAEGYHVLLRIVDNLIEQPGNRKYCRIKVHGSLVRALCSTTHGLLDCLRDLGYTEEGQSGGKYLVYDNTRADSVKKVQNFKKRLVALHERRERGEKYAEAAQGKMAAAECAATFAPPAALLANQTPSQSVFSRIKSSADHVLVYEIPELQKQARDCIPVRKLTMQASRKFLAAKREGSTYLLPDFILLELLAWFKHEFFTWVDAPPCGWCGGETRGAGGVAPLAEELVWWGERVENYRCQLCGSFTRFPRYNHPGKLLETRRGRCGEWANCFALCSRAMGLETRYVLDFTDHVWVEIYSVSQKRWLHADPCENALDTPLVYEVGWGKKLTYIFAFSHDDVADVIWRYSVNREETLARRGECGEGWLADVISNMRKLRQTKMAPEKRAVMAERAMKEMLEFFTPKVAGEGEMTGRQSGALQWRSERGESGESGLHSSIINLTERERASKTFHLQYCCASDKYQRLSDGGAQIPGWRSLVYVADDITRKEESDWKMVYLARRENSATARIVWKVKFSSAVVDHVSLRVDHACFESGVVTWRAYFGHQCRELLPGRLLTCKNAGESGARGLTLVAHLSGGAGTNAWQHTQLFRQGMAELNNYPLMIKVTFK